MISECEVVSLPARLFDWLRTRTSLQIRPHDWMGGPIRRHHRCHINTSSPKWRNV